jgi:ACS family hexuronate transporter-like MFS transporter
MITETCYLGLLPRKTNLRWWIGGLLFASTVINYIDRQTLSVLAPILKEEHRWTNSDFATILIAFRVAYTIMQSVSGRAMDWLGTRAGLAISVTFYSVIACLTSLAQGLAGFRAFRFLLGAGEAGNWPGATKAVSEWFPDRERGWAVALFDSGSSIGGAVAPFIVLFIYGHFQSWRPAFLLTGCLGFLWVLAWLKLYRAPGQHPRISPEELRLIREGQASPPVAGAPRASWRQLMRYRQTWGIIVGRALLDPYWFLIAEWFAIYLVSKGFRIEDSAVGFWVPFIAADLGNFFGGGLSSYWIKRGWPVGKARRAVLAIFGPSMLLLIPAAYTSSYWALIALFAYATFAYACCATIFLSLPADAFRSTAVASVSGLSGTGAGAMTLVTTYLTGVIADKFSFEPIIVVASIVPCIATAVLVGLVRANREEDPHGLLQRF